MTNFQERKRLRDYLNLYVGIKNELNHQAANDSDYLVELQRTKSNIEFIISHVEVGSTKRKVIDLRYKNGLNWRQIERRLHYTRSPLAEMEAKTIDELLKIQTVRNIIFNQKII
jgi:hypothetical protein